MLVLSSAVFYSQLKATQELQSEENCAEYEVCSKSAMDHFHRFLLKVYRINKLFRFAMKLKISLMSDFDE